MPKYCNTAVNYSLPCLARARLLFLEFGTLSNYLLDGYHFSYSIPLLFHSSLPHWVYPCCILCICFSECISLWDNTSSCIIECILVILISVLLLPGKGVGILIPSDIAFSKFLTDSLLILIMCRSLPFLVRRWKAASGNVDFVSSVMSSLYQTL